MIAIDALGTHHFIDEFEGSPKHGTTAKILLGVLEEILHSRKVFVAVTECAMLDDQPLPLPAGHGLSEEQVPCKPGDLMPNGWIDIVTHCIVLYLSAQNESESFFAEESEPNGAIVLRYADSGPERSS